MASKKSKSSAKADFQLDVDDIQREYKVREGLYEALLDEVVFTLDGALESESIKIHVIERRVKKIESIIKKCADKKLSAPFESLTDIAGTRIICLFRSDLARIEKLIRDKFIVIDHDDKVTGSIDSFGYMSVHFICRMRSEYSGPRYEKIKSFNFEIQVRTLSMHAWAAISHHLDYKGDWDVPTHLKKSLNALSALFYVADSQFEQFYQSRMESQAASAKSSDILSPGIEINLDTMFAYLEALLPERGAIDMEDLSDLVRELKASGYDKLEDLDVMLKETQQEFDKHESEYPPSVEEDEKPIFSPTGVVRVSLDIYKKKSPKILRNKS